MHKKVMKTLKLCGLCKKQRTLVESHLIPKSIYKIIVNKSLSRSPVLSIGRKSVKTSRQVKSHFLCRPCEEILSTNGETHVLRYIYRDASKFRFQEILRSSSPEFKSDDAHVYSGNKIPKIKIGDFVHFAAGVFWKASVGKWNFLDEQLDNNQLGKKYEKQFGEFLLGSSQFPRNAVLTMLVSSDKEPFPISIFPNCYKHDGYFKHRFYIPGIEFILWVGNLVPRNQKKISISHSAGGAIFFGTLDNSPLIREVKGLLKK